MDCETGACPPQASDVMTKSTELFTQAPSVSTEDPQNWRTFAPPIDDGVTSARLSPSIVIEFCNRCRWLHRATWVQTELFLTFEDKEPTANDKGDSGGKYATSTGLKSVQLIPCNAPETGGRFRVWLYRHEAATIGRDQSDSTSPPTSKEAHGSLHDGRVALLWDRKLRGGFPELKELKQIVRDQIAPTHSLGHSDGHKRKDDGVA